MTQTILWFLFLAVPVHPWPAPATRVHLQIRVQGAVLLLESGDRLEVLGDTVRFQVRGDTLVVRLRHRQQSWLARWGWGLDTLVVRLPRAVPLALRVEQRGGLLVLRGRGLRLVSFTGRMHRTRTVLDLGGLQDRPRIHWIGTWSQLDLRPDSLTSPLYLELQAEWSRIRLDLRPPPAQEVPVVLAAQFSWILFQTHHAPVAVSRQGILNLGNLPQDPRSPSYRVLLSGNFNRIRWETTGHPQREVTP